MVCPKSVWLVLIILISGCATGRNSLSAVKEREVLTFSEVYRRSKQVSRSQEAVSAVMLPAQGYVKPYLPVVTPPRVLKVWVPPHVAQRDRDVLVSGHWAFVMLEQAGWFIEKEVSESGKVPVILPVMAQKEKK